MVMQVVDQVTQPIGKMGKAFAKLSKNTGLDKLSKDLGGVGKQLGKVGKESLAFGKWFAAGATAAGGALFGLVKGVANAGDQIAKTADKLGVGIEGLQKLRYHAELAGVENTKLDDSLRFLLNGAGEAAQGVGAAKDAFAALGISVKDSTGKMKDGEALMYEVADAIDKIEDPALRVSIAQDLMGRSGSDMINAFKGGAAAMKKSGEEAVKLGIITEEQARASEKFNDDLTRLMRVISSFGYAIAADLMPHFNDAINAFKDFSLEAKPQIIQALKEAFSLLGGVVGFVIDVWKVGTANLSNLAKSAIFTTGVLSDFLSPIISVLRHFGLMRTGISLLLTALGVKLVAAIAGLFIPMAKLILSLSTVIIKMTVLATQGIAAAIKGFIAFIPSIIGATSAAWGFAAALLANPITWIVVGIAALVAGAIWLWNNWDQVSTWLSAAWGKMKEAFSAALDSMAVILQSINPFGLIINLVNDVIKDLFGIDLGEIGMKWIASLLEGIKAKWANISSFLGNAASGISDFFGFGDNDSPATANGLANNTATYGTALPSILPGGQNQVGGAIKVQFENAPANTRIDTVTDGKSGVSLDTETTYMGGAMGGLS